MAGHHKFDSTASRLERSIVKARQGSFTALGQLLDHYRDYLLRMANEELNSDLAPKLGPSDIVQETFLDAARAFPRFMGKTDGELKAWLRQILLAKLRDNERHYLHCQKRDVSREVSIHDPAHCAAADRELSSRANENERPFLFEDCESVRHALAKLPADYRRVIEMRHFANASFETIGKSLGRSAEAARKLWCRALERFGREYPQS